MWTSYALLLAIGFVQATFTQLQCTDSMCQDCKEVSFPENVCVPTENNGSAIIICSSNSLIEEIWEESGKCAGSATLTTKSPVGQCLPSSKAGSYFMNKCSSERLVRDIGAGAELPALRLAAKSN